METQITKGDLDDLFRRHLESAINLLLEAELTTFLDYEKYDRAGFNSGNSRNENYTRTFKTEYGELNWGIPRDRKGEFTQQTVPAQKKRMILWKRQLFNYSKKVLRCLKSLS